MLYKIKINVFKNVDTKYSQITTNKNIIAASVKVNLENCVIKSEKSEIFMYKA